MLDGSSQSSSGELTCTNFFLKTKMRELSNWQRIWKLFRKKGSGGTHDEGKSVPKKEIKLSEQKHTLGDPDWKLAWKGIGSLRPKTLDISSWDKKPKQVFSIFDSTPWDNDANMVYMRRALAQVTLKVRRSLVYCSFSFAQDQKMCQPTSGSDQLMILNVGGREFWTKVANLRKLPRCFL